MRVSPRVSVGSAWEFAEELLQPQAALFHFKLSPLARSALLYMSASARRRGFINPPRFFITPLVQEPVGLSQDTLDPIVLLALQPPEPVRSTGHIGPRRERGGGQDEAGEKR
jgi:hypothetical protein